MVMNDNDVDADVVVVDVLLLLVFLPAQVAAAFGSVAAVGRSGPEQEL